MQPAAAARGLWVSAGVLATAVLTVAGWALQDRLWVADEGATLRSRYEALAGRVARLESDPPVKTSVATEGRLQSLQRQIEEIEDDLARMDRRLTELDRAIARVGARER